MEKMGLEPQVCLTLLLLEGTDASEEDPRATAITSAFTDEPNDMYRQGYERP